MAASRGSSAWRAQYWGSACKPRLVGVDIAQGVTRSVDSRARQAFRALAVVLAFYGYHVRAKDTGTYNCRKITGGSSWSSHAWATSIDINWSTNPYRLDKLVTDMPRNMIEAIEDIRTVGGAPVFRWGGDWDGRPDTGHSNYDAMHFEVIATPAELARGIDWTTVKKAKLNPKRPNTWPILEMGDSGPDVKRLQRELNDAAGEKLMEVDGDYGQETRRWVRSYQRSRGLEVDGKCGKQTWTALFTDQPPLKPEQPSPIKKPVVEAPARPPADTEPLNARRKVARELELAAAAAVKELTR